MILASLGAEVVKVESLNRTDPFRKARRLKTVMLDELKYGDWVDTGYRFNEVNMGKQSVQVDLAHERGREIVRELVAGADVIIESFRTGAVKRLGLGFDRLIEVNPRIVMVSLSANGETGPDGHMPGYAAVFGATSGMSALSGYDVSTPSEYRGPLDQRVGTSVALAAIVGLMARDHSDSAVFIDFAASEVGTTLVGDQLIEWQLRGAVDEPMGNRHPVLAPHNSYECEDSDRPGWVVLAVERDEQWRRLAEHIGDWRLDPAWDGQARKAQEPSIDAAIADWARGRDRDELVAELQALGVRRVAEHERARPLRGRPRPPARHVDDGRPRPPRHARGALDALAGQRRPPGDAPRPGARPAQRLRLPRDPGPQPRGARRPRRRRSGVLSSTSPLLTRRTNLPRHSPIEARGRSLVSPKHKDLVRRNRVLCVSEILCRDRDRD